MKAIQEPPPTVGGRITEAVKVWARWSLRLLLIAAGLAALLWLLGRFWPVLLPLLLALLLTTVLWPPVRLLRRVLPPWLAALLALLALLGVVGGLGFLVVQVVTAQASGLATEFSAGLDSLRDWLSGPPFSLGKNPIGTGIDELVAKAQHNSQALAGDALTVLARSASVIVNLVLALVLAFFLLKDGPKFLPWLRGWIGPRFGHPVEEIAARSWTALGHFIWSQAAVAVADAILIGLGIWLLGVPFALPIAILIFFGAFIPIVGAFVTGGVAVLVALFSGGIWIAAATLGVLVVVEQLEGNVMQPVIVGKTLKMHPALVISVITVGAALYGIVGAFLSVPALAVITVIPRYIRETLQAATHTAQPPSPADPAGSGTGARPLTADDR